MAAQFIPIKGLSAFKPLWWIILATSSFPVPDSPVIRTLIGFRAAVSMLERTSAITEDEPTRHS